MRRVNIGDLPSYQSGETIPLIRGVLTSVWDRKTGTNSKGEWSLQNAQLKDSTGEIKVMLNGRDLLPVSMKNKEVLIYCKDGDKGLSGVYVQDDDYKGKTSRIVKVTKTGIIDLADPNMDHAPATSPPPPAPAARQQSLPTDGMTEAQRTIAAHKAAQQTAPAMSQAPPAHPTATAVDAEKAKTELRLAHFARAYLRCLDAAVFVNNQFTEKHGIPLSPDHFKSVTATLFIAGQREGLF